MLIYKKGIENICNNDMKFRLANTDDISNLIKIFKENSVINGGTLYCENSAPNFYNNNVIYMLEYNKKSIAYISLEYINTVHQDMTDSILLIPTSYCDKFIYIKQCSVAKEYQGKGYGEYIYTKLFEEFP